MSIHEESAVPVVDDRTRRQVENYRRTGARNGAQSILGVLHGLPTYKAEVPAAKVKRAPKRGPSRLQAIEAVVRDIDFMGQRFTVREIQEGFLIAAASRQWFVPPHTSDEDIVETVFLACQRMVYDNFKFRGQRVFPHRKEQGDAPVVPALIPARSTQGTLRVTLAPRESERVAKIIQIYFKVTRDVARRVVKGEGRGFESIQVEGFQISDLNSRLAKKHLKSSVHLTGCPKA